jgi:hypothetical protein
MNRRELLCCGLAIPVVAAADDCRDDNGMMMPDQDDSSCLGLTINSFHSIAGQGAVRKTARAYFGFGAYESLMRHQKAKEKYAFTFYGMEHRIVVTRLSVDVNREYGCVVCEVDGRLY